MSDLRRWAGPVELSGFRFNGRDGMTNAQAAAIRRRFVARIDGIAARFTPQAEPPNAEDVRRRIRERLDALGVS